MEWTTVKDVFEQKLWGNFDIDRIIIRVIETKRVIAANSELMMIDNNKVVYMPTNSSAVITLSSTEVEYLKED